MVSRRSNGRAQPFNPQWLKLKLLNSFLSI